MNLKVENIEIDDVMGEEIQILLDKAKEEGKDKREELTKKNLKGQEK